jgi:hypothetical protein
MSLILDQNFDLSLSWLPENLNRDSNKSVISIAKHCPSPSQSTHTSMFSPPHVDSSRSMPPIVVHQRFDVPNMPMLSVVQKRQK